MKYFFCSTSTAGRVSDITNLAVFLASTFILVWSFGPTGLWFLPLMFFACTFNDGDYCAPILAMILIVSMCALAITSHYTWSLPFIQASFGCTVIAAYALFVSCLGYNVIVRHAMVHDPSEIADYVHTRGSWQGWSMAKQAIEFSEMVYGKNSDQLCAEFAEYKMNYLRLNICILAPAVGLTAYGVVGLIIAIAFAAAAAFPLPKLALPGWLYDAPLFRFMLSIFLSAGMCVDLIRTEGYVYGVVVVIAWLLGTAFAATLKSMIFCDLDIKSDEQEVHVTDWESDT